MVSTAGQTLGLTKTGSVSGQVFFSNGNIASGSTVALDGGTPVSTSGSYSFSSVPTGVHTVGAINGNCGGSASVTVGSGASVTTNITLICLGGSVPGVPIIGATTGNLSGKIMDCSSPTFINLASIVIGSNTTKTSSDGNYSMTNIPIGSPAVSVNAGGYNPVNSTINIVSGNNIYNVCLNKSATTKPPTASLFDLFGTTTDNRGKLLSGVAVDVFDSAKNKIGNMISAAVADNGSTISRGSNYDIVSLDRSKLLVSGATYTVKVSKKGYQDQNVTISASDLISSGTGYYISRNFQLSVLSSLTLTGVVKSQIDGKPVPAATVSLTTPSSALQTSITDNNGQFTLTIKPTFDTSGNLLISDLTVQKYGYLAYYNKGPNLAYTLSTSGVNSLSDIILTPDTTNLVLYGKITDQDGKYLDGKIGIIFEVQVMETVTSSATLSNDPTLGDHNYVSKDLPTVYGGNRVTQINVTVTLDGYQESGQIYTMPVVAGKNGLVNFNLQLHKIQLFDLVGLIANSNNKNLPYDGVEVTVNGSTPLPIVGSPFHTGEISKAKVDGKDANLFAFSLPIPASGKTYLVTFGSGPSSQAITISSSDVIMQTEPLHNYVRRDFAIAFLPSLEIRVYDNTSETTIAGAGVNLTDASCPEVSKLNLSVITDAQGKAVFYSSILDKYLADQLPGCFQYQLSATVSKGGYITQNLRVAKSSSLLNRQVFLDKSATKTTNQILGHVYDLDNGNPISGAKVTLCPASDPACDPPVAKIIASTDSNGYFKFDSPVPGSYSIRAYSSDYGDLTGGLLNFNYASGQLGLSLYFGNKLVPIGNVMANILVLDQNSKKPVTGIKVDLVDSTLKPNQIIDIPATGIYGESSFQAIKNHKYIASAKAIVGDVTYAILKTTIGFPANYDSLSDKDQQSINDKNILYAQANKPIDAINKVKVTVTDCGGSKKPIPGASVSYDLHYSPELAFSFGLPKTATAITNTQGQAILPDNLTYTGGSIAAVGGKIAFNKDDLDSLTISAKGYDPMEISPKENLSVCLDENVTKNHKIFVNKADGFTGTEYGILDAKDFKTQILRNGSWTDASLPLQTGKAADGGTNLFFTPTQVGYKYRVISNSGNVTEWVFFDNSQDITIDYFVCTDEDSPDNLVKISDKVYLYFSDDELKNDYRNSDPKKSAIFLQLAAEVSKLQKVSVDVGTVLLHFSSDTNINAGAQPNIISDCAGVPNARIIQINKGMIDYYFNGGVSLSNILSGVTHEYGHLVLYYLNDDGSNMAKSWANIYDWLTSDQASGTIIFGRIKDGYANLVPAGLGGHPSDDVNELFASFFDGYFASHERFYGIIKYQTSGSAQNILEYMWQLFAENIGKVDSNDGNYFTPVGGKIGNIPYTYSQIKSGVWKASVYNKSSATTKALVQATIVVKPVAVAAYSSAAAVTKSVGSAISGAAQTVSATVSGWAKSIAKL